MVVGNSRMRATDDVQQQLERHQRPLSCYQQGHKGDALFGVGIKDLARLGLKPVVLYDCCSCLSRRGGIQIQDLFCDKAPQEVHVKVLMRWKMEYDVGKRPLKKMHVHGGMMVDVANMLMMWLSMLPEPLFPVECLEHVICDPHDDGVEDGILYGRLKHVLMQQTEPFILEAMYPLFEMLHHHYLNQHDRAAGLERLSKLFLAPVFGTEEYLGAFGVSLKSQLQRACAMLIKEYRPLFTQPSTLKRYEKDLMLPKKESQRAPLSPVAVQTPSEECVVEHLIDDAISEMLSSWSGKGDLFLERVHSPTSVISDTDTSSPELP